MSACVAMNCPMQLPSATVQSPLWVTLTFLRSWLGSGGAGKRPAWGFATVVSHGGHTCMLKLLNLGGWMGSQRARRCCGRAGSCESASWPPSTAPCRAQAKGRFHQHLVHNPVRTSACPTSSCRLHTPGPTAVRSGGCAARLQRSSGVGATACARPASSAGCHAAHAWRPHAGLHPQSRLHFPYPHCSHPPTGR